MSITWAIESFNALLQRLDEIIEVLRRIADAAEKEVE